MENRILRCFRQIDVQFCEKTRKRKKLQTENIY